MKTERQLERYFKGPSNHWRISILNLLSRQPGLTLEKIAEELEGNFKTLSEHTKRLEQAGLLDKSHSGRAVTHKLSPYGKKFVSFFKTF